MTGIASVLYLNQTPSQPRERDYAYAGSFYAFAIWIGMGVAGLVRLLQDYAKMKELPAAAIVSVACLFVPVQMQARLGTTTTAATATWHATSARTT